MKICFTLLRNDFANAGALGFELPPTLLSNSPDAFLEFYRQQNADVIAYMLNANMWPAGGTELARDLGALKQISIQSSRPERKP